MIGNLNLMTILYRLPALFVGFTFHEYAHAWVADRLGDDTPRLTGRLRLDPFAHIDILGMLMLLIAGFGWAKPVQVNPGRMRGRHAMLWVSLAGPLTNLIIGFIFTGILVAMLFYGAYGNIWYNIVSEMVSINLVLCVFNLIPLPPLDGYNIVKNFIHPRNLKAMWTFEKYGPLLLMALVLLGFTSGILSNIVGFLLAHMVELFVWLFNLLGL